MCKCLQGLKCNRNGELTWRKHMCGVSADDNSAVRPLVTAPSGESEWSSPQGLNTVFWELDVIFEAFLELAASILRKITCRGNTHPYRLPSCVMYGYTIFLTDSISHRRSGSSSGPTTNSNRHNRSFSSPNRPQTAGRVGLHRKRKFFRKKES
jgi:hypothetical protein